MTARLLPALVLAALVVPTTRAADEPKPPAVNSFDKQVIETLREIHNTGADLYNNAKDFNGAYRLYQGSLQTVRPLLGHRPEAQKIIDTALDAAAKTADPARRAFLLHEGIQDVRKYLKAVNGLTKPDPLPPKPDDKVPVAPMPKEAKPKDEKPKDVKPKDGKSQGASGKVMLAGKPLAAGEVTFVSLDQPAPRVFSAAVKDGAYTFAQPVPAGKYAVLVTGAGVPEKYTVVTTPGLRMTVAPGAGAFDFDLK